ncbi:hypothetical protein PYCCODRAFT_782864 [Trametes coccinea BRFM310]|uniref:Uncharacterized protein n=1 Tax=Trametes coccinea (strain BRFM310) TaxID=1353009 RepID=A0A1Y2J220_TRAC3|nr:hypothetical protein PYCCODRAFT_782864 [Trametes coccinea BRFM310]
MLFSFATSPSHHPGHPTTPSHSPMRTSSASNSKPKVNRPTSTPSSALPLPLPLLGQRSPSPPSVRARAASPVRRSHPATPTRSPGSSSHHRCGSAAVLGNDPSPPPLGPLYVDPAAWCENTLTFSPCMRMRICLRGQILPLHVCAASPFLLLLVLLLLLVNMHRALFPIRHGLALRLRVLARARPCTLRSRLA